jgi:DNA primase
MPGIDYASVRRAVPMSRVLELLGFRAARRNGQQLRGSCPLHRSSSPQSRSFSVNLATNAFRCFTCGASGNQLDLWRQIRGLALFDAAVDLCECAHVPVPWSEQVRTDGLSSTEQRRGTRENSQATLKPRNA